jgi:coenzyme F420-0:L-glutamate ligase/coenzyme F420-1:gamma-L-glutamate ligase
LELLRSRRSVRRFQSKPVPDAALRRVLEAATWAPSAHNRQPWRFVVLTSSEAKSLLADTMGGDWRGDLAADGLRPEEAQAIMARSQQRILEAPVAVLLCLDASAGNDYPDARRQQAEYLMGLQGVALAGGHLLLAAHAEGLGGVWMCAPLFAQGAVRRALDLPATWQPQGLILLGYPLNKPSSRPRRPIEEITLFV